MRAVRKSTIDVPLHAGTHVPQLAGQWEAMRGTNGPVKEIESATVVGSGSARRISEEFECVTKRGKRLQSLSEQR